MISSKKTSRSRKMARIARKQRPDASNALDHMPKHIDPACMMELRWIYDRHYASLVICNEWLASLALL